MIAYAIDLDSTRPEVLEFSGIELKNDLDAMSVTDPEKLSDYDRKVFNSLEAAERYLERYNAALRRLKTEFRGKRIDAPCMLYKRRYMAQTLMREKLITQRTYRRAWKSGSIFQFHDQVLFLPVRLLMIKENSEYFEYHFQCEA